MQITPIKTKLFKEKDNLIDFLFTYIPELENGDVIAITSKIISISQGRIAKIKDKKYLIKKNSKKVIETSWVPMTLIDEGWCINAGIDESNANNKIILLPKDIFKEVELIRKKLMRHFGLKKLGIIVTDTKTLPLRAGTIGRTIAYTGFEPFKNHVDKVDLFGKKSLITKSNIADALSASAVLNMGEENEQMPIAIIKNAPIKFTDKSNLGKKDTGFSVLPKDDIYSCIYKNII